MMTDNDAARIMLEHKAALYDDILERVKEQSHHSTVMAALIAGWRPRKNTVAALRWTVETFGAIGLDRQERAKRLLEEAMELAQAEGVLGPEVGRILTRVYSRPAGDTTKEIGQTMFTLAVLAENIGVSALDQFDIEFMRVQSIPKEEWAKRHAAKVEVGIA